MFNRKENQLEVKTKKFHLFIIADDIRNERFLYGEPIICKLQYIPSCRTSGFPDNASLSVYP